MRGKASAFYSRRISDSDLTALGVSQKGITPGTIDLFALFWRDNKLTVIRRFLLASG